MPRFSIGIYHNGETAPFCSTSKLTQNESFMGQNFVSITIESPAAIGFKVGDYLTYRGRKFVLAVTPSMQKQARVNSVGNAIKYDNIKFISVASDELTRCEFRDVVNSTTDHYNFAARTFSFHCLTLKDYAERLKANLDRMYGGYTIKILLDDGNTYTVGSSAPYNNNAVGEKNKVIQISNETCWDSLQHVKADFKVNLYFDGDRTIVLGANGHLIAQHHFAYGAGEGLFKISRTTDESQAIITRLRAYGSEKNMPTRFYANLKYLYLLPKEMIVEAKTSKTSIDLDKGTTDFENDGYLTIGFDGKMLANSNLSESNKFTSSANGAEKYLIKVRINNVSGWMNIQFNGADNTSYANIGWNNASEYGNNTETSAKALVAEFCKMQWTYFVIEDGATETWKYKVTDPSCVIPNNMNVKCLMLAGFGFSGNSLRDEVKAVYDRPSTDANKKLIARLGYPTFADFSKDFALSDDPSDPHIDAVPQKEAYGVREGTVVFDGTTEGYDEIYPSIEYIGGVDTCPAQRGKVDGSDKYEGNNLRNDGGVIDDITEAGKEIPQFYLYIKDPSFNPYDYRKSGSDSFKINMIDGMCGGRSFDVKQAKRCTFEDGSTGYRLVCDRVEDNSLDLYFPYSQIRNGLEVGYVIKAGDRYTFSDIEMPSEYVLRTALYELFPAAIDALKKNRDVRFKYELSVDANEMHRQHLLSLSDADTDSIHDTIHAGDLILFGDKDLGVNYDEDEPNPITGSVIINSIEIKENNERLPQYSIRLVDEKTIGTIERIQRQIESIMNGSNGSGSSSGYAASEIQRLIRTYGSNYFLSKQNDDTAKGKITFDKGADFGKFVTGISGQGARIDNKGDAEFQNLRVWRSMTVTELRFDRASVLLGTNILTYCGGVIKKVEITGENSGYIDLETDEDANGEIAGGIGSIQNGALCVGYFHDIEGGNDIDDSDDFKGTIRYKGTKCVQFAIDWKEEGENGYNPSDLPNSTTTKHIRYELREGTTQHPVEGMTFKGTGNMKDPSLGYFTISTPKYTAKYAFVTSWEWDAAQCVVEVGGADISGFGSIVGEDWTSPKQGTICTNLYTRGVINQATNDKRYLYVTQDSNGMLKSGESEKITIVVRDSYFHNRTAEFSFKLNGEPVENLGEEAVAYVSFEELDDEVSEFVITATDGKKHLVEQTIKIRKLLDGLRLEAGKAAIGEELVASVLRYHGTTRVTNGYLWYEIDNGGLVSYTEGTEVRLASTNNKITFWWYEDEMRLKLIAKLELPVVKNGEDGKNGVDGESAYVIITDREVVKPDEESTLVYFDGFKAAVQWDGGAPVGVTNESIVVRACRCRGNRESNEGSFIYRLDGGEAHAMTNGGSVTVEKKSGIKSVTFCWLAENGATLAQKIVYVVLDGESPVFADLDNEMDSIVTDKDGNFEGSVTLSTNVAMYHGLTKLSPTITAATATGITSKVDGGRVSFTVTQAAADRNEMDITLTAVIEDVTYTRHLTFTIVKQRKGNTGDPAVVYSLAPSYSAIKVDKYGNRVVKSIVCNVAKTTGKDESVLLDSLPEGMKVKWQMDDSSSVSSSSTIPTINVSAVKNQLVLMLDYDGTVIDRETIPVMSDGVESFKEMVFKRQSSAPSKPSGGSFASPIPDGWSDGIPDGEEQVWTSSRTFYSDNRSTADWTDPVQLSDTADFDVCYHADETKPTLLPTSHHTEDQGNGWHNVATGKDWWMATDVKKNGEWRGWQVSRIKGEKGNSFDEAKYYFKSTPRGANTPSVSLSAGVPNGWSTNIAETNWGEKVSNDFHYWLWQVIVETVVDNVGNKTYKAQSAQMIDEYDPKKTGVAETYCANNDANNHPTSGWTTFSSARASFGKEKPYLWKRERRTYSDGSIEDFYSIFDKYVENGKSAYEIWLDNGNEGTEADFLKTLNGRAVAKVEEYYGVSSYPSTQPAIWYEASKFDKKSHNESNRYLWNKERTFDQDEKLIVETTPVVIAIWTKDGRGIKSITEHYLATSADSGVTTSTYGWDIYTKMSPTDKYLWNYETITYTEGSPASTDPVIIGVYGDKGDPGDPGKQGLQGLIVRTGEWVSGAHYRCDEGVDCGFIDVVLIKNDSSETGWDAYKCIKGHPSSSSNSPTSSSSSEYWQRMYNIGALFTSLIIAKYAKLTFAQANQLLLENANSVVTGGLSGGSNIQIWAGSEGMNGNTPINPKFYVTSQGEMYAKSGVFEGSIKTKFVKNSQNINVNNSDKVEATGEYRSVKLPNRIENVGREVTIYNSMFNLTRVPSETVITVEGSGNFMGAKVKECSSYGSVYSPTKYANEIHFWGGIVKLIALPDTANTCLWMVMFVNVEGGSYVYNDNNPQNYAVRDINDASSVNGLRLASGKTAGDEGNTIYFVTE